MTTNGNSIQATILLDSGAFMTDEEATGKTYSEVGYFIPHIVIYVDGEKKKEVTAAQVGTGCQVINISKVDENGNEIDKGITLSECLTAHLLRLDKVYDRHVHVDRDKFDCIFYFNTGHICSSKLKNRHFREHLAYSGQETQNRKYFPRVAHDIAIHFDLQSGQNLKIGSSTCEIWPYNDAPTPKRRLDIEILADNSTAKMFYCDSLKLRGSNFWLPNQGGDPPPIWTHGGQGGGQTGG
ncbi:MAG TPA: hypothetical protein VNO14_10300 [Blastocatellia bacterium]|nr:hypothetical protein [Blastocatellia bacterium]